MKYTLKGNYFSNKFVYPQTTGPHAVETFINRDCPADLSLKLWSCPIDYQIVDEVIHSALTGFESWRKTSIDERIRLLKNFQEIALSKKDQIAEAISLETGKPLWEALGEAAALAAKVDVTINESLDRIKPENYRSIMNGADGSVQYKPIGPSFVIGPFNFPCHLANGQITSLLLSGNSVIFKPSEKTCYSGQLLAECFIEAGFPPGVINLIQGDGEIARRILKNKSIRGVFFTGSKEVGLAILNTTATHLSKITCLELGGKAPAIIHHDAKIEHALSEMLRGSYLTTGQRCTSTSIIAIHRSLKDEFIDRFHKLAKRIVVDHPIEHDREPFMGPLVDKQALNNYLTFMGMAKREGIEEIMRGKQLEKNFKGYYVTPSIHYSEKFDQKSHFLSSEIFGPNCVFIPYDDIEEAISISNSTEYGLAGCLFSEDRALYEKCLSEVEIGVYNFNQSTVGASSKLPFGGVKNSGNFRPAAVSTIDSCVHVQSGLQKIETPDQVDFDSLKGLMD